MTRLIQKIEAKIRDNGWTMVEFADRAGITRAYAYRILRGDANPSIEVAERMAEAIGLRLTFSEKFPKK